MDQKYDFQKNEQELEQMWAEQGYDVFYPFGFDDNGLPTERLVEQDEKIRAHMLPRSVFRERCLETMERYEEEFRRLWQRLGFSVDWSLQYQTISNQAQRYPRNPLSNWPKAIRHI